LKDVEDESVGVKKGAAGRGVAGSKRSRAAEVHNLSERVSKAICYLCHVNFETTHIFPLELILISILADDHNLCIQRRRDRINEKMRALQELIPNCNKVSFFPSDFALLRYT